jgi:hypothetical protein
LAIASSIRLSSLVGLTAVRMRDGRSFFTRRRLRDFHHVRGHYLDVGPTESELPEITDERLDLLG